MYNVGWALCFVFFFVLIFFPRARGKMRWAGTEAVKQGPACHEQSASNYWHKEFPMLLQTKQLMQQECSWDLLKKGALFKRMKKYIYGNTSTAVNKGKMQVPVTELRYLAEHLNQLCTVDTVGVVSVWLIHFRSSFHSTVTFGLLTGGIKAIFYVKQV